MLGTRHRDSILLLVKQSFERRFAHLMFLMTSWLRLPCQCQTFKGTHSGQCLTTLWIKYICIYVKEYSWLFQNISNIGFAFPTWRTTSASQSLVPKFKVGIESFLIPKFFFCKGLLYFWPFLEQVIPYAYFFATSHKKSNRSATSFFIQFAVSTLPDSTHISFVPV